MNRAPIVVLIALACSSAEERARQAAEWKQLRDSLLSAEVVTSLQSPASVGHLIYDRPADLSYDSLRVTRPDLASAGQKSGNESPKRP